MRIGRESGRVGGYEIYTVSDISGVLNDTYNLPSSILLLLTPLFLFFFYSVLFPGDSDGFVVMENVFPSILRVFFTSFLTVFSLRLVIKYTDTDVPAPSIAVLQNHRPSNKGILINVGKGWSSRIPCQLYI